MGTSASIANMRNAIIAYIKRNIPHDTNRAKTGIIQSKKVVIDNKSYPFVSTIDDYVGDGDRVFCILPDSGNLAAVVGKI